LTLRRSLVVPLLATAAAFASLPAASSATNTTRQAVAEHGIDPGLDLSGAAPVRAIVTGVGDVARVVERSGGVVAQRLPIVNGVVAELPARVVHALATDRSILSITADRAAHFSDMSYDASAVSSNFVRSTQASAAWDAGDYGQGVGVAVIDTGVSPMNDLSGRLVHGPDLSGEGSTVDTYGHGTVMAGIIAGNGADSDGAYPGVAPGAHIVAVKVAGANGAVDVSTILQAMTWIAAYKDQFNIRVLNLSWGVSSTQDPAVDPLNYAVERLWSDGIVVVVAAGNSGPYLSTITKPADDPVVLTVGAINDKNDSYNYNDQMTNWSSRGPTAQGLVKPDVVAPGRTLIALRSYGSTVETQNPSALIAPSYIKGSGTSQAAAVTSGVVALLLQARPDLTPDQVKDLLMSTALHMFGPSPNAQGRGRVQVAAALAATPTGAPQQLGATGLGSLEASRGGAHVTTTCNDEPTDIVGEVDVRCDAWDPQAFTTSAWSGDAWTGVSWKGAAWTGVSWKDVAWSDANWDGVSWKGGTWTSDSWEGSSSWNGSSSPAWTGVSWKDSTWTGVSWKQNDWAGSRWRSANYGDDDFDTAFWGSRPKPGRRIVGETYTPTSAEIRARVAERNEQR
jgi:serine protease AprX